ncbi:MAG: hypothetical protein KatS3mg088_493 [Patescibacteria group bacterium]|nr:MAG: hypothetical protein KatS3mg088_493 [Patescibacteria group bacterium]
MSKVKKFIFSELFWLFLILIFGFLVRIYKINNPLADWHSWRQADTSSVSRIYFEEGINILYPRYYDISSIQSGWFNPNGYRFVEFPLFNVIHTVLAKLGGPLNFEGWGRMTSIIFSLFSVVFVYLLGKRFISPLGGLLSAFFFAFLPYNIYYSRVILPEPMATSLALFSVVLFVWFLDRNKLLFFYLSSVFLSLAVLVKPHAIFYLVPIILLFIEKYSLDGIFKNSRNFIRLLLFFVILILPFLAWRVWVNQFPAGIPFMKWSFNGDMIRFHPAFWRWIFGERLGYLILGVYGVFIFGLGIISRTRKENFIRFFLVGMFLYVSIFAAANVRHDYYQIFIIPSVSLALAQGGVFLVSDRRVGKIGVFAFSVFMMFFMSFYKIKDYYQINHPEIIEAGKAVDELTPKNARIIAPYNGDTAFLYQTKRFGWPAVDSSFDKLINERGAKFYVSVEKESQDSKFIRSHFKLIKETDSYFIADLTQKIK